MAAPNPLKQRIQLLQAAIARGHATGKTLKPELQAELDSYEQQGLLGANQSGNHRSLPTTAADRVEKQVDIYAGLKGSVGAFKDDFGGNTVTGSLENTAQSLYGGFGTAGQRDWWAQFQANDNTIRHELFGAALTPTEKASYEATTISPSMNAKIIRENLTRREGIIRAALGRKVKYLKANGYRPDAVDALLGEYGADLSPSPQPERGDPKSGAAGAADRSGKPPVDPLNPDGRWGNFRPGDDQTNQLVSKSVADDGANTRAVTLSDEQKAQVTALAESGASAEQIHAMFGSFGLSPADSTQTAKWVEAHRKNPALKWSFVVDNSIHPVDPGGGAETALADGVTSNIPFAREIGAVIDGIRDPETKFSDNLNRRKGERLFNQEEHPWAYTGGAALGSLPLGGIEIGGARAAASVAGRAALRGGASLPEARAIANRVFATRTALDSAAQGGVYSMGNADGRLGDRLGSGVAGALLAGSTGVLATYGGGRVAQAMAARAGRLATQPLTRGQEVLAAAERQGITPFPADVGGGATRRATSAAAQTIGGNGQIVAGAQRTVNSAQAVRDRVAASFGTATNPENAGEVARQGASHWIEQSGTRIGGIYDRASAAAAGVKVDTPRALKVLDDELAPLREAVVDSPGTAILQGMRAGLATPTTIRGLRSSRTALRAAFENAGLRGSNEERVAGRVLDAASTDMAVGLRAAGHDPAAAAFETADRLWRERLNTIDNHLAPILGDATGPHAKSGEQIVQSLSQAASGNNRRFVGFLNTLPPQEQGVVRASLIQRLGQAPAGQQDAAGEVFSLATFLTQWNKIGERAKDRLFGAEGRAALNDLAQYAHGSKQAQRYANHSNSGGAGINVWTAVSGASAWGTMGATLLGENLTGRLLASPRFARWLARAPRQVTPSQRGVHIDRLARIARSEPAIVNEVLELQSHLRSAFGMPEPGRSGATAHERRPRPAQQPAIAAGM